MFNRRIKIFIILLTACLLVCLFRLAEMQILSDSFYRDKIAKLKQQRGLCHQFQTVRGKILDRKSRIIALDEPLFQLLINYKLCCFMDERVRRGKLLLAAFSKKNPREAVSDAKKLLQDGIEDLTRIIEKSARLKGVSPAEIEDQIRKINDFIWFRRSFQAWRRSFPDSEVFEKYNDITSIPLAEAMADFEKEEPDPDKRIELVSKVEIAEMHSGMPLLTLKTDDDIFTAQLEFMNIDGVEILAKAHRVYPYGSAAAQTVGWVGPATQAEDKELFADDKLSSYLDGELCGREDGIEYVCEAALRGRRGQALYDIDRQLIEHTESRFGKDITLTIDIELQQRIEQYLATCDYNPNCRAPMAAVVLDVENADILALVSMPVFDLNRVRYDYEALAGDPNRPLRNRAINMQYPPGSVIKPLILIAGLETGNITEDELIDCPAQAAPKGWPNCWIYNRTRWTGHSDKWPNRARNAIKGSCNIYFSRLAERIEPSDLQQWLFKFCLGRVSPLVAGGPSLDLQTTGYGSHNFRQTAGVISSSNPNSPVSDFGQIPVLEQSERRFFGIGQGNLRATPLQVANAMAAIARGGVYKPPQLFVNDPNTAVPEPNVLNISPKTLDVVRDGMYAVVNDPEGTAYKEFAYSGFAEQGVSVYGKTGSTERPEHAWFAGFAEDSSGRAVAIAVIVEGGRHGSSDAGPLARNIIQFCIDAGCLGQVSNQ